MRCTLIFPVIMVLRGKMESSDLTEKIIGCAFKVYNQLGFGYLE